jgi:hypothetical protein
MVAVPARSASRTAPIGARENTDGSTEVIIITVIR